MIFSKTTPAVLVTVLIGFLTGGSALACSTDGWDMVSGDVEVGSPFGTTLPDVDGISRYEELCALRANAEGYVQSNSPSHPRVRGSFYVLPSLSARAPEGAADARIFKAFSSEVGSGELFHISHDGSNWIIDATANNGGSMSTPAMDGWTHLEFDWDPSGSGNLSLWVDLDATVPDAPTVTVDAGDPGTMESVQVGMPDGPGSLSGVVNVDTVELRNETAIGPTPNCDANGDTNFNVLDLIATVSEINEVSLAPGTPDCNFSGGTLNVLDLIAMVNVINAQ